MSSPPVCPKCDEPINIVWFKIYEDYAYNPETGSYDGILYQAEGNVICSHCNLVLNGTGVGFDDGPVNFNRKEYDKNIEKVRKDYQ